MASLPSNRKSFLGYSNREVTKMRVYLYQSWARHVTIAILRFAQFYRVTATSLTGDRHVGACISLRKIWTLKPG